MRESIRGAHTVGRFTDLHVVPVLIESEDEHVVSADDPAEPRGDLVQHRLLAAARSDLRRHLHRLLHAAEVLVAHKGRGCDEGELAERLLVLPWEDAVAPRDARAAAPVPHLDVADRPPAVLGLQRCMGGGPYVKFVASS